MHVVRQEEARAEGRDAIFVVVYDGFMTVPTPSTCVLTAALHGSPRASSRLVVYRTRRPCLTLSEDGTPCPNPAAPKRPPRA